MLDGFLIAPLRFTLTGHIPPRPHAFTFWHGGLGKMLNENFPDVFDLLYEAHSDRGRLYAILPPQTNDQALRVTLFGAAVEHIVAVSLALFELTRSDFSGKRAGFSIERADVETPVATGVGSYLKADGEIMHWPSAFPAIDILKQNAVAERITINLLTPLILKEGNQPLTRAPEFSLLVRRLLGRIAQICHATGSPQLFSKEDISEWLRLAESVRLTRSVLFMEESSRRSGRTGNSMVFSGFGGQLTYEGEISPFLGLLALGKKLQLGGKTAFGFGGIDFELVS